MAAMLTLIAGFGLLGPANARAEVPDAIAFGVTPPQSGVTLFGAWHVLVHYVEAASSGLQRERWDDRAWVFEREGDRLRWTEYPIVVFDDQTGRFERDGANRASRTLHHWQPNQAQLADIKDGLAVNERGVASAALRLSDESSVSSPSSVPPPSSVSSPGSVSPPSWVSASKQAISSASVIRYEEGWFVEQAAEGPIFRREETLRSERAEDLGGVTIYTTREVADGGRLLRGDFERDGVQHGTFTMTRASGVHGHGD